MDEKTQYSDQNLFGRGFPCPRCQNKIITTAQDLLGAGTIVCSKCNLQLNVDMQQSKDTLLELQNFNRKHSDIMKKPSPPPVVPKFTMPLNLSQFLRTQKVTLIYKDESRVMRLFNKCFYGGKLDSVFMNYYATAGKKGVVYIPRKWWEKASDEEKIILLRHEIVHHKQMKHYSWPLFFFLYSCIPFPIGFAYFRAKFEKEAYVETLRARYEYWGADSINSSETMDWITKQFVSGAYGWMWPFKKSVERWYKKISQEIIKSS